MTSHKDIDSVLDALYRVISGPAGHVRDWSRLRALFLPSARLMRTGVDAHGRPQALMIDVADYPANFEKNMGPEPFFEIEVARRIDHFGNIAQVFSTYEAWQDAERTRFIKRGINSIQLYNDGAGWKIVHMIWDNERPGLAVPTEYLPAANA